MIPGEVLSIRHNGLQSHMGTARGMVLWKSYSRPTIERLTEVLSAIKALKLSGQRVEQIIKLITENYHVSKEYVEDLMNPIPALCSYCAFYKNFSLPVCYVQNSETSFSKRGICVKRTSAAVVISGIFATSATRPRKGRKTDEQRYEQHN